MAAHNIALYTNLVTVSGVMRETLTGPKQRLFVFFRTPAGTMLAASHGKYFSHSDVDYNKINPITDPPPVSQFRRYTPINATDLVIYSAGVWLKESFVSWDAIPTLNTVQVLNEEKYWVNVAAMISKVSLGIPRWRRFLDWSWSIKCFENFSFFAPHG